MGSPGSTVQANSISNFKYPAAGTDINAAAYGVFIEECAQGGTVAGNTISNTQVGIYLYNGCLPNGVSVTNNDVSNASLIAIDLGGTNGVLQGNDIRDSLTAIRIPGSSAGNLIQKQTGSTTSAPLLGTIPPQARTPWYQHHLQRCEPVDRKHYRAVSVTTERGWGLRCSRIASDSCTQYTIPKVPNCLDAALRRRAQEQARA